MSASLYFRPTDPQGESIGNFKSYFIKKYQVNEREGVLTRSDIPFIEGIMAADEDCVEDGEKLIAAIERLGEVEIYLVY